MLLRWLCPKLPEDPCISQGRHRGHKHQKASMWDESLRGCAQAIRGVPPHRWPGHGRLTPCNGGAWTYMASAPPDTCCAVRGRRDQSVRSNSSCSVRPYHACLRPLVWCLNPCSLRSCGARCHHCCVQSHLSSFESRRLTLACDPKMTSLSLLIFALNFFS